METNSLDGYLIGLIVLAAYAKALNMGDFFEQARSAYDTVVRDYNNKYCPQKGFWAQYKDNFIEAMGGYTSSHLPKAYFDEEIKSATYTQIYDLLKNLPYNKVAVMFKRELDSFNKQYK